MSDQYVRLTVSEVRRRFARDLDIPENAPAVVSRDGGQNTVPVPESYTIQHGDLLEFVRPAGTKG
jgi:hypothetical protein